MFHLVEEVLTRAFAVTHQALRRTWWIALLLVVIDLGPGSSGDAGILRSLFISVLYWITRAGIAFYLSFWTIQVVGDIEQGTNSPAPSPLGEEFLSYIVMTIYIMVVTCLGLFLLLIPGIVYLSNRILSPYILAIEGGGPRSALAESKRLMLLGRWYHISSPQIQVTVLLLALLVVGLMAGFGLPLFAWVLEGLLPALTPVFEFGKISLRIAAELYATVSMTLFYLANKRAPQPRSL